MRVAVFSESEADEAAIRIFAEALLGTKTEPPAGLSLRRRAGGFGNVLKTLPAVAQHLHYRTDAQGLIVVLDSDLTATHQPEHDEPEKSERKCRLCQLKALIRDVQPRLRPVPGKALLKIALGLAVPQIEAWYLAGVDPHVGEAAWIMDQPSGQRVFHKGTLKMRVYGTDRPGLDDEKRAACDHATRLVAEHKLQLLEQLFPSGFGWLVTALRSW